MVSTTAIIIFCTIKSSLNEQLVYLFFIEYSFIWYMDELLQCFDQLHIISHLGGCSHNCNHIKIVFKSKYSATYFPRNYSHLKFRNWKTYFTPHHSMEIDFNREVYVLKNIEIKSTHVYISFEQDALCL